MIIYMRGEDDMRGVVEHLEHYEGVVQTVDVVVTAIEHLESEAGGEGLDVCQFVLLHVQFIQTGKRLDAVQRGEPVVVEMQHCQVGECRHQRNVSDVIHRQIQLRQVSQACNVCHLADEIVRQVGENQLRTQLNALVVLDSVQRGVQVADVREMLHGLIRQLLQVIEREVDFETLFGQLHQRRQIRYSSLSSWRSELEVIVDFLQLTHLQLQAEVRTPCLVDVPVEGNMSQLHGVIFHKSSGQLLLRLSAHKIVGVREEDLRRLPLLINSVGIPLPVIT